jgi:exodeoxyribonuclease VII large subunit
MLEWVTSLEGVIQRSLQFQLSHLRNRVFELSANRVFASAEGRLGSFRQHLDELAFGLDRQLRNRLAQLRERCHFLVADLSRFDLLRIVRLKCEHVTKQIDRVQVLVQLVLQSMSGRLRILDSSLQALSPQAMLSRGYAICRDAKGNVVRNAGALKVGDTFNVRLWRGRLDGWVEKVDESGE